MKILFTAIGSLLLLNASAQQYEALKLSPDPIQGKKTVLTYEAESTGLSTGKALSATVYFYSKSKQTGEEKFSLVKKKTTWEGAFKVPDSTVLLSFIFSTPDAKTIDNNLNKGYLIPVYDKGKPVQFAYASMSGLFGGGPPDAAGLKKDQKQALIFMKEEMRVHPESEANLRSSFYNMLANSPEREDKVELVKKLNALKSDKEEDLMMAQLYLSYFGGKRQADSLDRLLTEKFPNGNYLKAKKMQPERTADQTTAEPHKVATQKSNINKAGILKNVKENLVDEPVNPIGLKDINGNAVTIGAGALKGKVIVLDFWATWCKPCIASFPAMQKVMEQYRNNPSVQFFFINTMEQGDAIKNVKAFMAKNSYPFRVLMDEKTDDMNLYKAYSGYKAEGGIPYKLVIDGNGHIRSRKSGFSGNEEELVTELSATIDIALKSNRPLQNEFNISGDIKGLNNNYVFLNWQQGDSVKLDSALVKEGKFKFKGHVIDPSLAVVFLKMQRPVRFYLENTAIEMNGEIDSLDQMRIKGSATQEDMDTYNEQIKGIKNGDQVMKETISFIAGHPDSYLSVDKLQELSGRIDYMTLDKLFGSLGASLKQSIAGKRLAKQVEIYKNTSIGSVAPVFSQQDVNGKPISLTELRGKYVLLDFWASWCVPCRKENPNVLEAYNKFRDKGLTILAVSLDDKAENWKKAIAEDQMPWLQVSDLKGTDNAAAVQYGIFSIPSNFLIDPNGKIIAKNLRGEELQKKLAEIIK